MRAARLAMCGCFAKKSDGKSLDGCWGSTAKKSNSDGFEYNLTVRCRTAGQSCSGKYFEMCSHPLGEHRLTRNASLRCSVLRGDNRGVRLPLAPLNRFGQRIDRKSLP